MIRRLAAPVFSSVVVLVVGVHLAGQHPPAAPLRLLTSAGARPVPTVLVGDVEMIALDELASTFQLTVRDDTLARAVTVTARGKTIVLTPEQSLASVAGRLVSLPAAPARMGGRWHVPLEFVPRALALIVPTRLDLRKGSRLLIAGDLRVPRVVVRRELPGDGTRLVFDIAPPAPHTIVQEPGRLVVRFEADALDATLPAFASEGWVQALRVSDAPPSVVIELGPRFGTYRATDVAVDTTMARLVVDVSSGGEPPSTTATATPAMPPEAPPVLSPATQGLRTIVIDPGHGGAETGARGARGTLEKDVALAIARRVRSALEARLGARILFTRDGDTSVPLDQRASLANNNKADLFVSIHANGSVRPSASGAEVFYAGLDRADVDRQRAAESGTLMPVFGGGTRAIDILPWDRAQARYVEQSAAAAALFEAALRAVVPMNPRGLQPAPLRVLVGANMPAVLLEIAYLTNAEQEDQLRNGDFQGRVAQAIADGIARLDARARGPAVPALPGTAPR